MEKNKLFVVSLQCTMFFGALISLDNKGKIDLLTKITSNLGALLNGEPTLLPVPLDAPPDIPRLQLNSKDNSYAYGISLKRSDFTFNQIGEPNKKIEEVCEQLFPGEREILKIYKETMNWNINRLGIVVNCAAELEEAASNFISSKFLTNSPSYNSIELGLLKKDELDKFHINRWFRIRNFSKSQNILNLMIDINTLAEEKLSLGVEEMMGFYNGAIKYLLKEISEEFKGILK